MLFWCFVITIFCIVYFEAVALLLDAIFYFACADDLESDFRLITTSKHNFSEIHISRPTP